MSHCVLRDRRDHTPMSEDVATDRRRRRSKHGGSCSRCWPTSPQTVTADAEDERELLEGLRVVAQDHRTVLGAVGRGRPRAPAVLRHEPADPDGRRPQPRRQYLLAMIRGDRTLPGHRNPRHDGLSRLPGARRHRADAATDGRLPQRHRPEARRAGRSRSCSPRPRTVRPTSSAARSGCRSPQDAVVDRRARVRRRPGRRTTRDAAHRDPRRPAPPPAAHRRRAGRTVHRDGLDAR